MFDNKRTDDLAAVVSVPQVAETRLNKHLSTGERAFTAELNKAIVKAEKEMGERNLVNMLANSQLGYLVYEAVGKQLASQATRIHPSIVNTEGKNVTNQDVILGGIIAQLQAYSLQNSKD